MKLLNVTILSIAATLAIATQNVQSQSVTTYSANGYSYCSGDNETQIGLGGSLSYAGGSLDPALNYQCPVGTAYAQNIVFTIYGSGWQFVDSGNPSCQINYYYDGSTPYYGVATDQSGSGNYYNVSLQPQGYGTWLGYSITGGWGNGYNNQQQVGNSDVYWGIRLQWNGNTYYGWIEVATSTSSGHPVCWIQNASMNTTPNVGITVGCYDGTQNTGSDVATEPVNVSTTETQPVISVLQGSNLTVVAPKGSKVTAATSGLKVIKGTTLRADQIKDTGVNVYSGSGTLVAAIPVRVLDRPFGRRNLDSTMTGKTLAFRGDVLAFTLPNAQPSKLKWTVTQSDSSADSVLVKHGAPLVNRMAQTVEFDYFVPKAGKTTITFTLSDGKSAPIQTLAYNIEAISLF